MGGRLSGRLGINCKCDFQMKWIRIIIVIAVLAVAAIVAVKILTPEEENPAFKTQDARIKNIRQMVDLCTADIHEEWAVKDSVNGMWVVARQTIEGRIRFDLDNLHMEQQGDTTIVYLPTERVDIFESASPGAYEVLDVWDDRNLVFKRTLTTAEENILKARWQKRARSRVYERGYVKDARANAVASLTPLLRAMRGSRGDEGVVIIIDTIPAGNPPK